MKAIAAWPRRLTLSRLGRTVAGAGAVRATAAAVAAPNRMPLAADLLIGLVGVAWICLAAYTIGHLSVREALLLLPIVIVTGAVGRLKLGVYMSGGSPSNGYLSLTVVGNLAAGMLFGVPGTVASVTATYLLGWTPQYNVRKVIFNVGALSLANSAAVLAFGVANELIPGGGALQQVPGALLAGAVSYLGESVLLTLIVSLSQRRSARAVWVEQFRWLLPHWMGLGVLALGMAFSYRLIGIAGLLAFAGPALLMRYVMKQYLDHTVRSVEELRQRNTALADANREIEAMSNRLQETYAGTLEALVSALDARDQETHGHSSRVAQFTAMLAAHMGVPRGSPEWYDIERGALLHDVGKIGVPDAILRKPGKLTDEEWVAMRRHPDIGWEMLKDIPFLAGAAEIVGSHHERWDGKGYPQGLKGEEIPLGSRIFAVADTFDAMTTDRPYRRARPYPECLAEITRCSGTQFDPAVVAALHAIYPQWIEAHQQALQRTHGRLTEVA